MAKDKQLHLIAGLAMGALFPFFMSFELATALGIGVGAAKEVYDYYMRNKALASGLPTKNTPDILDFVYTAVGVLAAVLVMTVVK